MCWSLYQLLIGPSSIRTTQAGICLRICSSKEIRCVYTRCNIGSRGQESLYIISGLAVLGVEASGITATANQWGKGLCPEFLSLAAPLQSKGHFNTPSQVFTAWSSPSSVSQCTKMSQAFDLTRAENLINFTCCARNRHTNMIYRFERLIGPARGK